MALTSNKVGNVAGQFSSVSSYFDAGSSNQIVSLRYTCYFNFRTNIFFICFYYNITFCDGVISRLDGASKAIASNESGDKKNYVSFVTKPSASKLTNADLSLGYTATKGYYVLVKGARANGFDAEGTYTVKVALDNGKSATATFEVKEFATPVKLLLTYKQEAIELGGTAVIDTLRYVDANGVTKAATDVELAAKGYAIEDFYPVEKEVSVLAILVGATLLPSASTI